MWRARKNFPVLSAGNMYGRLQIAPTFKRNRKKFELSGVRSKKKTLKTLYLNWPDKTVKDKEYTIALKYVLECSSHFSSLVTR